MTELKKLFLLLFCLISMVSVRGSEVRYFYADVGGSPVWFALAEHPVITYADNQLCVTTSVQTILLPVADIREAGFKDDVPTDVCTAWAARPQIVGSMVCFRELTPGSQVTVYTADGKLVNKQAVGADGMATVAMQKLPKGVCIIKSQYQTIKINNK